MIPLLANGIPKLGCGTWQLRGAQCASIVSEALQMGYRHIDTAQGYDNESAVGDGLRAAGIARDLCFITTKVRPEFASRAELVRSVENSLKHLQTDYVDLLLIHWPNPEIPLAEMMTALSDAKRRGLTRKIGVSNFTIALLDEAVRISPEPIVTNQIEYHPYVDQTHLLAAVRRHKLAVTAYCPLALGRVANDPVLAAIGAGHGKTAAEVALRWLVQQGDVIAIPKTASTQRLRENMAVFDFDLTADEMRQVNALAQPGPHLVNEPAWVSAWD